MEVQALQVGSYPRIDEGRENQRVRRAISKWEKGEIDDHKLREVQNDRIKEVIDTQETAGLDQITDGLIRWYGPISHMVRRLENVGINGLVRYFDTNFYVRQPEVNETPKWERPSVSDEYNFADQHSDSQVRQVLTGPLTLAHYSIWKTDQFSSTSEKVRAYVDVLAEELESLQDIGASVVQLDEHALKHHPDEVSLLMEAYNELKDVAPELQVSLSFSFGSASTAVQSVDQLEADEIVIDTTYPSFSEKELERIVNEGAASSVVLGILDARNTKMEDPEALADTFAPTVEKLNNKGISVGLSPSTGLELLPASYAREKLEVLSEVKDLLQ